MESAESPLEVLSRAATMIQETQQHQGQLINSQLIDDSKNSKQLPTTKWKRDRRTRTEYARKSDPKIENSDTRTNSPEEENETHFENGTKMTNGSNESNGSLRDAPLDMSLKPRGLPPSYSQAISDPTFRSSYRPSVISGGSPTNQSISMCDPIIDEHFRRSLGKDYNTVFSNNNVVKDAKELKDEIKIKKEEVKEVKIPTRVPTPPKKTQATTANVIELMDGAGLSVDDHFAKALGDTWLKLNKKDIDKDIDKQQSVLTT